MSSCLSLFDVIHSLSAHSLTHPKYRLINNLFSIYFFPLSISEAKDEIIQLNLEMFTRDIVKDTTPGAMLFFSALHDRNIVPNLQQLMLQMSHLKGKFRFHFFLLIFYHHDSHGTLF